MRSRASVARRIEASGLIAGHRDGSLEVLRRPVQAEMLVVVTFCVLCIYFCWLWDFTKVSKSNKKYPRDL